MGQPSLESYRDKWISWVKDALLEAHGVTFDRTAAGVIIAPLGFIRVCAWHVDFDERPTCYQDVATPEEATRICANLVDACSWNVDFATAHDAADVEIVKRPY
jgi:hypothetical protein